MVTSDLWIDQIVRAGKRATFTFQVGVKQADFRVKFDGSVGEWGKDLRFYLMTLSDYKKWTHWLANQTRIRKDEKGRTMKDEQGNPLYESIPEPETTTYFDVRSSVLKEETGLKAETYTLVIDNSYSTITDKSFYLRVTEQWNVTSPPSNLPIIAQLNGEVPDDVSLCLQKANECYTNGHYEQSSVMLRKAVEFAIRIKLLQAGLTDKDLLDNEGNELSLSKKIALLRKQNLITNRTSKDLDTMKWFGDTAAHGQMKIVEEDIRENVEPKVRSFLVGLNLKA